MAAKAGKGTQRGPIEGNLASDAAARVDGVRTLLAECPNDLWDVGRSWYPMVRAMMAQWAQDTGYSTEQCAAVLANYSIRRLWNGNLAMARRALYDGEVAGFTMVVPKVHAILALDPSTADSTAVQPWLGNGRKVPNFYGSIMGQDCCAVDMWVYKAFGLEQKDGNYAECERGVRLLAHEHGMAARDLQAVIWLAVVAREGRNLNSYHPEGKGV